jgi:hypothetical protein
MDTTQNTLSGVDIEALSQLSESLQKVENLRQSIVDKIHQNSVKSENERTKSLASSFKYLNDSDRDSTRNVNLDGYVDDDFEDVIDMPLQINPNVPKKLP